MLLAVAVLAIGLVAFGVRYYGYARIGIGAGWMLLILAVALLGSVVKVPVAILRPGSWSAPFRSGYSA